MCVCVCVCVCVSTAVALRASSPSLPSTPLNVLTYHSGCISMQRY